MIYFLQRADGAIKIGTTGQYHVRVAGLKTKHGNLTVLGFMDGAREEEAQLHRQFALHRIHPKQEWFRPNPEILEFIKQYTHQDIPDRGPVTSMTMRITDRTKIALDLFAARQMPKVGRYLTNDEAIVRLLNEVNPELIKQAERLEQEHNQDNNG